MRNPVVGWLICLILASCSQNEPSSFAAVESLQGNAQSANNALYNPQYPSANTLFARKAHDEMVEGAGQVVRLLKDDNKGSRHQRFLVEIAGGQTLLFAHNIDLAMRINALKVGDKIQFRGEYSYNPKGGVVHWTHLDPRGGHPAGWVQHNGITYQ